MLINAGKFIFTKRNWKVVLLAVENCLFSQSHVRALEASEKCLMMSGIVYTFFPLYGLQLCQDFSSNSSSQGSEIVGSSDEEDGGRYFVFNGDFAPYQGWPIAVSGECG